MWWADIRALQRLTVNRGLVKFILEEYTQPTPLPDQLVERVARDTEDLVLSRMSRNCIVPPLNRVIIDMFIENPESTPYIHE